MIQVRDAPSTCQSIAIAISMLCDDFVVITAIAKQNGVAGCSMTPCSRCCDLLLSIACINRSIMVPSAEVCQAKDLEIITPRLQRSPSPNLSFFLSSSLRFIAQRKHSNIFWCLCLAFLCPTTTTLSKFRDRRHVRLALLTLLSNLPTMQHLYLSPSRSRNKLQHVSELKAPIFICAVSN